MGVKVSVEHFSVDYNAVYTNDIVGIYRFSIKETWYEIIFGFIKKTPFIGLLSIFTIERFSWVISLLFERIYKIFKGTLSDLQPLATESPLKMIKNSFYFNSIALFVLKIFKFLSWLFGHVSKPLD